MVHYRPEVFFRTASTESAPTEDYEIARQYLHMDDVDIAPSSLIAIGDKLAESAKPEFRYYAAWCYLEAAFPGYFSMEPAKQGEETVETAKLVDQAEQILGGLSRRVPYYTERHENKTIAFSDFHFGIRAEMIYSLFPAFKTPKTYKRNPAPQQIVESTTKTAVYLRKQDQAVARMFSKAGASGESLSGMNEIRMGVRGVEAENAILGLAWLNLLANGQVVVVPASPRLEYGMTRRPSIDLVAIHRDTEHHVGISVKRDAARSRKNEAARLTARVLLQDLDYMFLYGDRDLGLPVLGQQAKGGPPDFTDFDAAQAKRVMEMPLRKLERLAEHRERMGNVVGTFLRDHGLQT